jgi:group II intron reverse transcriptase/maturase
MSKQLELLLEDRGEAPNVEQSGEPRAASRQSGHLRDEALMERIVERSNVEAALRRVRRNKGSPGIDGMTVEELGPYVLANWKDLQASLLAGTYQPQPVRRHEIAKASGGTRKLGIPTARDRLIQQCILQVLQPRIDPSFSEHSYGFRPGRSAHDAVQAAQRFIQSGRRWVVDVDLEAFFDRVNHDVLMERLARRIADRRVLRLIRAYLTAGIMDQGVKADSYEGTPQGGPLSPLLANVLLDDIDRALESRGHALVRYADDCNIYVHSKRAGERTMALFRRLAAKLRLRLNETKSAVARPQQRTFLGYSFYYSRNGTVKRRVAPKALTAMKMRVRSMTRRSCGRSIEAIIATMRSYLRGWKNYFQLADTPRVFEGLDGWIRHRVRALQLKHWKRGTTMYRELRARGTPHSVAHQIAANRRSWWNNSGLAMNMAFPLSYFDALGLPRLNA